MEITASMVSELREKSGLGMMTCKKALQEASGNMELAIETLRKQGQLTLQKRAGKAAKEGIISIVADATSAIVYEVNSETDFVARNDDFIAFVKAVGEILIEKKPTTLEAAKALSDARIGGQTVDARLIELTGKIGEFIGFRRFHIENFNPSNERVLTYLHGKKIGVLVKLACDKPAALDADALKSLGKDLAMQVAAANPMAVSSAMFPAEVLAKEKEIYLTQAQTSGKPEKIWDKIIEGKMQKLFKDSCLVEQEFIKDTAITVNERISQAAKELGAKIDVLSFMRWELGAGE